MISNYFSGVNKKFSSGASKKVKAKAGADSKTSLKAPSAYPNLNNLKEMIAKIIPSYLEVNAVKPIDRERFSPDGADLIIYKEYCKDIVEIMGGYIPFELVYGSIFVVDFLDKKSLGEVLNRVVTVKKLNFFSKESQEDSNIQIPAFVIAYDTAYSFFELKNDIINFYMSNGIDGKHEFDLMVIFNRGTVVKNWREKRNFVALETNEDSAMWFFVLLNEYLMIERNSTIDFREYVKKEVTYKEY